VGHTDEWACPFHDQVRRARQANLR
jgi:hypothetical protein